MNKAELVDALTERLGDKKTAAAAVDAVVDVVVRAVNKGEKVTITGFGVFEKRARAARMARNPRTGETVKVKKTNVPAFRAGTMFKDVVSGSRKLPRVTASARPLVSTAASAATSGARTAPAQAASTRSANGRAATGRSTSRTAPARSTAARATATKSAATETAKASTSKAATKTAASKSAASKTAAAKTGAAKPAKAATTKAAAKPAKSGATAKSTAKPAAKQKATKK